MQDGIIVPVFEKTRLEYSYLASGISETVRLARDINVSPFFRVQLIIRVHSLSISAGTQAFTFTLTNTLPSEVDPREFSEAGAFLSVAFVGTGSYAVPLIVSGSATDPGAFLKLAVTATQSTTGTTLYGEFSGALVLRRA